MKAQNDTTGHNRTIRITEIPEHPHRYLSEMSITIGYLREGDGSIIDKAVTLDNVIIPAIIEALNKHGPDTGESC